MTESSPYALVLTHRVLRVLIVLNWLMGFGILVLFVSGLIAPGPVFHALGVKPTDSETVIRGMRMIMVIGIIAIPITNIVLTRLKAIVETVSVRDPFVIENAARLQTIAWAVLTLELSRLVIGGIAKAVSVAGQPLDIGWNFSVTRWLAVLLCFVLARVFDQGARMRDDLEGTV